MTRPSGSSPFEGLTLERLQALAAVGDAGGIARAAPGDPSRQSQLSRQLREVSEALGFEVTERRGGVTALTPGGARVRAALRDLADSLEAARRDADGPVSATLVAGDSVLRWLVLPRLHEALASAPRVTLAVRAVTRGHDLARDGEVDFAVSRSRAHAQGMLAAELGALRYALFVPHGLARRRRGAAALEGVPFVDVTGAPDVMAALASTLARPLEFALRCETFPQAALAVATGRFAALLPTLAARELPRRVVTPRRPRGMEALDLPLALVARARRLESTPPLAALHLALARTLRKALAG